MRSIRIPSAYLLSAVLLLAVILPGTSGAAARAGDNMAMSPVFSHKSGWYGEPFQLTLSTKEKNAVIYYTLDGSVPDESSFVYRSPITIRNRTDEPNHFSAIRTAPNYSQPRGKVYKGTVVRARVYSPGLEPSEVITHTYFVDPEKSGRYTFPVISVVCDPDDLFGYERGIYVPGKIYDDKLDLSKPDYERNANYMQRGAEWERPAYIEFFETDGTLAFDLNVGIRIHGGASRATGQKSLRIYAKSEYDDEKNIKYEIFPGLKKADGTPLAEFKRLILRNGGNDYWYAYFRDALMQDLIAHTGLDIQASRPAIVFINGEYWGFQNIRERFDRFYIKNKYDVDENRVVILEGNGWLSEGVSGDETHYNLMLEYIGTRDIRESRHYEYIKTQMDVDNYIDYQISQIYYANDDWPGNNIKFWRVRTDEYIEGAGYLDGRWRWMVFDTDFGFGLYEGGSYNHQTLAFALQEGGPSWPNPDWSTFLFRSLMKNEEFKQAFVIRFTDHLNTTFAPARVIDMINRYEALYEPEIEEHINRWNSHRSVGDWRSKVDELRIFASNRPGSLYTQLNGVLRLGGTSRLTLDCDEAGGYIRVNTVDIKQGTPGVADDPYPFSGMYFRSVPTTLTAHAYPGYRFAGWVGGKIPEEDRQSETITLYLDGPQKIKAVFERLDSAAGPGSTGTAGIMAFAVPLILLIGVVILLVFIGLNRRSGKL